MTVAGAAAGAAAVAGTAGVVVPAYFHPAVAGADWLVLAKRTDWLRAVVLNVHDGPGTAVEPALAAAAAQVSAPLLGYVDTDYGARPARVVAAEVSRYRDWYPVVGVFLDRVSSDAALLSHYDRLMMAVRARNDGQVVFNHGTHPDPRYAELADALGTFEGPETAYRRMRVPSWTGSLPADRFWHLVYATPRRRLGVVLARAAARHAGTVYVTDRSGANPWAGLPSYLGTEARAWRLLRSRPGRRPGAVAAIRGAS